jgi:hypothetical protein
MNKVLERPNWANPHARVDSFAPPLVPVAHKRETVSAKRAISLITNLLSMRHLLPMCTRRSAYRRRTRTADYRRIGGTQFTSI